MGLLDRRSILRRVSNRWLTGLAVVPLLTGCGLLIDAAEQVSVTEVVTGPDIILELRVGPGDMGRVIGRQGRIARSMRTLLTIAAMRKGLRASLDIDS